MLPGVRDGNHPSRKPVEDPMTQERTWSETQILRIDEVEITEPVELAGDDGERPASTAHRRVREGELYYVMDEAAPHGWSIVEVASSDSGVLAAFAVGQVEAIPLSEVEERILGPVAPPPRTTRPRFAA
jgi:hypothetical protein